MPITTEHPEYTRKKALWRTIADCLEDESIVKAAGPTYLPKTGGMEANDASGKSYDAYRARARFPDITSEALTGIIGLVFEEPPEGASEEPITPSGQTNTDLARDTLRGCATRGRDILLVDAPREGGEPFVTRYGAEALINWRVDPARPSDLLLAVLEEQEPAAADLYGHETRTVYRRYFRESSEAPIEVTRWIVEDEVERRIEPPILLPVPFMPIVCVGSIDILPGCDPLPLLPVGRCALAYYRKSASYEHSLYLAGQPTPYVTGLDQEQYDQIRRQGIGSSALWHLGDDGRAGFLETSGIGLKEQREGMAMELHQAETYAVRLVQRQAGGVESAAAMAMRAAAQHASIYSLADGVSDGVQRAERMRARWSGRADPARFRLRTEFSEQYASEQMVAAIDRAVTSGNAPRSVLFETFRRANLTSKSDEELAAEIEASGAIPFEERAASASGGEGRQGA